MKTLHTIYNNFAKHNLASLRLLLVMFLTLTVTANAWGEDVKYTVSSTSAVIVSGTAPDGSSASYNSTYNNAKQLTSGNSMTLTLSGYEGCTITGLTLSMKSNTEKGAGNMSMKIGSTTAASISTAKFNTSSWYGSWSTSYVDVTPSVTAAIVGKGEKIVITIAATENSLYCQSFTLTYEPSSSGGDTSDACGWVETELDDVQSSDVIVITMTNSNGITYAMSNNNGTSSAPAAVEVEVDGTSLTSEITDNIKWNVGGSNDAYTFYPNGDASKWLYATSTNNGVRVGTNANKTFKIDATSGYLFHNGTSRYIGVYNSQDWRCYTTVHANIQKQTLKFYKYVPCGPTETTISFDANGGAGGPSSVTATKNEQMPSIASSLPSRIGYTFKGYYDVQSGGTKYYNADGTSAKEWDKDDAEYTLYAQWTANQHSLTWNLDGGTVTTAGTNAAVNSTGTASGNVAYGTAIKAPVVIKTGYTFAGWHDGNAIVTPPNTMPDHNISYKAQWTANTYTVQFDANEGTGEMEDQLFTYDVAQKLSANTFSRTGYNFTGWNTADDGSGTSYADKAEVKNLTFEANGVVTLYAQWTAKKLINYRTLCTYDIVLKNNYGDDDSKDGLATITSTHTKLSISPAPSAREGYMIEGYYAEPECTIKVADNNGNLMADVTNYTDAVGKWIGGETILYTKWTGRTYTVTLDDNGGSGGSGTITATYGSPMPVITLPTRTGYTFNGYWTGKTTQSTKYYDANGSSLKNWDKAGNTTTLYALWTANTNTPYVVKHYKEQLDGKYPAEADDTDNLTGTTAASVTPAVNSYEGFTAPSTQTVSIAADGSTVVTYQYTRNSYNLSWNVNEGDALTGEYTSGNVKYEAAITQPNTPTRTGYTFIGWSPAEIPATMPANNLEFIAQWAAIYTVTWMVNGSQAEGDPTTSVVNGQTITTLPTTPDVDCNGKVFVGWTTAEIVGETTTIPDPLYTELGDFPVVTSNMTFYAVFANGSGDERWLETEINDIEATDEVVIAMQTSDKTYAMYINDDATATPDAIVVEPSDLTSVSGIATGSIWFIEKDGNGKLIIHPKKDIEKNLYCNLSDNNNRVRVGKSHDNHELNKTFEIDGNYLKNSVTLHYIGVNFTHYRWYGYTDKSYFPNQTLKFYKKTTVYTSYTNYSTSCMAGVCDITNANPIYVTSAVGQKIKATDKLVLTTTDMTIGTVISLSAPNITFYKEGVEITQLTTESAEETFELEIAYQPTISKTTEQPTITLEILGYRFTFNNKISCRSLPETFAIVAKVGNVWYALPSQGLNSTTPPAAYPVEVDNMADPTAVTSVPANADWSLRQVYASSGSNDRFADNGEKLVFVNDANPQKALNAGSTGNYLLTDAQDDDYHNTTTPGLYEWTPTTTDLETYQLTNEQRSRTLSVNTATVFGVHSDNKATTEVRFLPIQNRYTPAALQVIEWKENSVVIMYNGDPAQTASVSVNGAAAQNTTLSAAQRDIAVYELAATGLADNPTQRLSITIGTEKVILSIPYIISGTQTDYELLPGSSVSAKREAAKIADLIVLNAATLTAAGSKSDPYKFRNVTIYGGGSLIIPAEKGFGASTLTMRVGGVEDGEYVYTYPQLDLNGTINSGNINLDLMTTYDYYYPFSVPYEVTLTDIHYPIEIYGSNVKPDNKGSFLVSNYDGEARAQGNTGWKDVEEQGKTVLSPHVGYSIWGLPKKVSVNGVTSDRQTYGIHRIPMKNSATDVMDNETKDQDVSISAYDAARDNDKGWNFIGNPYLVQHGGLDGSDADVYMGLLVKEMKDGQWTGGWVFNGEQVRYVTQTNDCLNYTSTPVADATIPAFSAFFIQAKETGAIAFTSPNVAAAQSLTARRSDENKEITTGIILSGEKHSDRTGLLIADEFTEAYEFNADLSKFDNQDMNLYTISSSGKLAFMAINEDLAKQTIPLGYSVSTDGMYSIAFDEQRYSRNDIYALYLIDYDRNETTNLLHMDYNFYSETGAHAERFALQVAFAPKTPTDVEYTQVGDVLLSREGNTLRLDNLPSDATVTIYDAVGHLVEQHTASQLLQLTLQKGYYLLHIGNNQNSVVIDTFIP